MIWRPSAKPLVMWSDPCKECGGTGCIARPRESLDAAAPTPGPGKPSEGEEK